MNEEDWARLMTAVDRWIVREKEDHNRKRKERNSNLKGH